MPTRDLVNDVHPLKAIAPAAAVTDNTAIVSSIVDCAGYDSLTLLLVTGTNADADATCTVLIEDGDAANLSDAAAVDDAYLIGTEALASYTFADDGETRKIGYKGSKRYVRATVTPASNTGNVFVAAIWLLGHGRTNPQANPPV